MPFSFMKFFSHPAARTLIMLHLVLLAVLSSSGTAHADAVPSKNIHEAVNKDLLHATDQAIGDLHRINAAINTSTLSLDNMAEALGYEAQSFVDYVTDDIGFLPYAGSMRGPIGTMETGSASALDQALLLGGLMEISGVDVVLAHGTLQDKDVERLLQISLSVDAPISAIDETQLTDLDRDSAVTESLGTVDITPSAEAYSNRLNGLSAALEPYLNDDDSSALEAMKAEIKENYVWVRYRDLPTDPWMDVHPAFGGETPPPAEVISYSNVEVPEGRGHTYGFDLLLEVTEGKKISQSVIARFKPQTVASLSASQIELTIAPVGVDFAQIGQNPTASYFTPFINGQAPDGAKAFSKRGRIVNAQAAQGSGGAAGSLFGDMNAKLSASGTAPNIDEPYITGLLIKATYESPLGQQTRIRPLIDLSRRSPGQLLGGAEAMISTLIDVNIGESNGARSMATQTRIFETKIKRYPYLLALAAGDISMPDYASDTELAVTPNDNIWMSMILNQDIFLPARFEDNIVVPQTALVSMITKTVKREDQNADKSVSQFKMTMDLMFTDTVLLMAAQAGVQPNRESMLRLGIDRTLVETLMMRGTIDDNSLTRISKEKLNILDSPKAVTAFATKNKISSFTRDRMMRDFESAGIILASSPEISENFRWWKIDQANGEALGMNVYGGANSTNYNTVLMNSLNKSVDAGFFMLGVGECFSAAIKGSSPAITSDSEKKTTKIKKTAKKSTDEFKVCMHINSASAIFGGPLAGRLKILKQRQKKMTEDFARNVLTNFLLRDGGNAAAAVINKANP